MTPVLRLPPLLLLVVLLHTTLFAEVRVAGVAPELLLLVAVAAGIAAGPQRGAVVGFAAGLVADLFLTTPFGLSALVYCLTGYAVGVLQGSILRMNRWIPLVTVATASALAVAGFALAGAVVGQTHLISERLVTVALVVALLHGILALPAVRVVRWTFGERGLPA